MSRRPERVDVGEYAFVEFMPTISCFSVSTRQTAVSISVRQVNPGHVQEFIKSCEEGATKRPHGYFMLDLKPTTDDQDRLKSNVLPKENTIGQQNLDLDEKS